MTEDDGNILNPNEYKTMKNCKTFHFPSSSDHLRPQMGYLPLLPLSSLPSINFTNRLFMMRDYHFQDVAQLQAQNKCMIGISWKNSK